MQIEKNIMEMYEVVTIALQIFKLKRIKRK